MNKIRCTKPALLITSGILLASWAVYTRRTRERTVSQEGLDDPDVTQSFNKIACLPQMRLLRRYAITRALNLVDSGYALDLGCGPGFLVQELAYRAPQLHVTGIDISVDMISAARDFTDGSPGAERVDFKPGDAAAIPFPEDSLDLVISTLSLHHWSDPIVVFNEIYRVLRPGGAYMIFDLRRDMPLPAYTLLWFVTNFVVPAPLKQINEPLGSRNAAYTPVEAQALTSYSSLSNCHVTQGPLWLTIEGKISGETK